MALYISNQSVSFKILIGITFLISIVFSSSIFSGNDYYQSLSKLSAGIFFGAFGINMKNNLNLSILFFTLAAICIFLGVMPLL